MKKTLILILFLFLICCKEEPQLYQNLKLLDKQKDNCSGYDALSNRPTFETCYYLIYENGVMKKTSAIKFYQKEIGKSYKVETGSNYEY